ncbi:MAG: transporter substrate-binding domain-containing protein [Mycetocola sp.]
MRSSAQLAVIFLLAVGLTGCGSGFPADPDGTLDRVTGGNLRVGISANGEWTRVTDDGGPSGTEVELVESFADTIDADIAWVVGGEEGLFTRLEDGDLDLVIGGITDETPWVDRAAITKPYIEVSTSAGPERHVMAAAMGENAFLVELERFLLDADGTA